MFQAGGIEYIVVSFTEHTILQAHIDQLHNYNSVDNNNLWIYRPEIGAHVAVLTSSGWQRGIITRTSNNFDIVVDLVDIQHTKTTTISQCRKLVHQFNMPSAIQTLNLNKVTIIHFLKMIL